MKLEDLLINVYDRLTSLPFLFMINLSMKVGDQQIFKLVKDRR